RAERGEGRAAVARRSVRPRAAVADLDRDVLERQAELVGGDLAERSARAGADVLRAGDHRRMLLILQPHPRVARRAAAARDPVAGSEADAAAPLSTMLPLEGSGSLLHAFIAAPQALRGRVRLVLLLVPLGVVAQPQLDRIHAQRACELVHRRLEAEGALRVARRAEGDRRTGVGEDLHLLGVHIGAAVERAVDPRHGAAFPARAVGADLHQDARLDGRERAVAPGAEAHALARRVAVAGREVFGVALEKDLHRAAGAPGEQR